MSEDGRGTQRTTTARKLQRAQEAPRWFDDDAGPVVRPYAMTRGRTTSNGQHRLDLIAVVVTEAHAYDVPETDRTLSPEHVDIVGLCRDTPQSVAELAAELDLPIGVVRVLIGDLVDDELVHVTRPVPPAELPDESILRDVISGLRAL
ncbi:MULTISPECIES: DUF742 domain-containing protein [unclassified Streptomyces]|uniref:DUF742 domain-containing protein n=1 Tax=unclassified Streptomyces TaxID=2593676 RepID=UPI00228587AF|nr:DUF742 domain-containing protein [Streptomyces sp. Je 1-369]WAL94242.1 DUF742 domain-containing protein [Streptomyces sp. Je 1-369]